MIGNFTKEERDLIDSVANKTKIPKDFIERCCLYLVLTDEPFLHLFLQNALSFGFSYKEVKTWYQYKELRTFFKEFTNRRNCYYEERFKSASLVLEV